MVNKFQIPNSKFQIPARRQAGFTLIELLTVIAIIAVLAAASLAIINPVLQLKRAKDSKRKADLAQIQSALELYRSDQGAYPASLPACGESLEVSGTVYLRSTPCDPINPTQVYTYLPSGSPIVSYSVVACLENVNDSQKDSTNNATYCDGTTNWSFTVKNP